MARRSPVTHDRRKTFSAVTSRKYCKKSNGPLPNNSFDVTKDRIGFVYLSVD